MLLGDPKLDVRERSVFLFGVFRDQLEISEEPQSGSSEISIFRRPLISDGFPCQTAKNLMRTKNFWGFLPLKISLRNGLKSFDVK